MYIHVRTAPQVYLHALNQMYIHVLALHTCTYMCTCSLSIYSGHGHFHWSLHTTIEKDEHLQGRVRFVDCVHITFKLDYQI